MAWPVTGIREIRRYLAVVGPLAFELCVLGVGRKGWGAGDFTYGPWTLAGASR